jgi:hypothetical protein
VTDGPEDAGAENVAPSEATPLDEELFDDDGEEPESPWPGLWIRPTGF